MKVKYRIVREGVIQDPKTGLDVTHKTIIKANFRTKEDAEEWNAKKGNPGYTIEAY